MPVILATQEAEIRRIEVRSQPRQTVHKTLFGKNLSHNKRADGVSSSPSTAKQTNKQKTTTKNCSRKVNREERGQNCSADKFGGFN
jgi:hypothetical protein